MPVPTCNLQIYRPTPATVLYTVSTRAPLTTVPARLLHYSTLAARIVVASLVVLASWLKWISVYPGFQWPGLENELRDSRLGRSCLNLVGRVPTVYLVPASLAVLWLCAWKGYREESLLVLRGLGIQTTSSSATFLSTSSTRFIPTTSIQDIFIHEAFKGLEVRFYLAIVVEGEQDVVVVFPNLLPSLNIIEKVWRGARSCLYEPKT
ncbi:uncharacterized protein PV09_06362 [Verruconis gallopava]|uniref:Phosphatidylinositol N-acetylglucosaminyltransferase subunit H conserved domain-containing protein n=1 Tax=Verruconis gallopava TaxID=253628 RepID=A0A0D1XIP7_9PEZI|nr:uncharacterized protein PV09_06362 [Verruconis gallopava]KIW02206.1 hypothetical protein PV09_06362 [Verruconis gallopava]